MITRAIASDVQLDMVSLYGPWGPPALGNILTVASTVWNTANQAAYFPMFIPVTCPVKRFWWANGTTVNASATYSMAMYHNNGGKPGAKIGTNSTLVAQGAVSTVQFAAPSGGDFVLSPGLWWIAIVSTSVTTTHLLGGGLTAAIDVSLRFQETVTAGLSRPQLHR